MGQGLGKNSPVTLSLGKESYEAMIERHGQYVRWIQASVCPCVTDNNQTDPHCTKCGGAGYLYGYQKNTEDTIRLSVMDGIIELPEELKDCTISKIYNYKGIAFDYEKEDRFICLTTPKNSTTQGEQVDIVFSQNRTAIAHKIKAERICKGFYRLSELTAAPSTIQGVYYQAPCDVLFIDHLTTYTSIPVKVKHYFKNCIELDDDGDFPFLWAHGVEYVKPLQFIILSQHFNKESLYLLQKHSGDAVCTYPYKYAVAQDDVITVLSGSVTNKRIITRGQEEEDDKIPEFFIESITSIETTTDRFQEGVDFVLASTNTIRWLKTRRPPEDEKMSVTYRYNPTYKVLQNIAGLRTSENQRIPRKVILKLFSGYHDKGKVQFNG